MSSVVPQVYRDACGLKLLGASVCPEIRAADGEASVVKHPSQGAHAIPADTDEVITFVGQDNIQPPLSSDRAPQDG